MSKRVIYRVMPNGDVWQVKKDGSSKSSGNFNRKEDAINRAKVLAKSHDLSQVIIYKQDGKIQIEYTYGEDPRKYKG